MDSLKKELVEDMKSAMKENQEQKVAVIRNLRAAIKNEEITRQKELSNEEVIAILAKKVKQYQKSIENYRRSEKQQAVNRLQREIAYISNYLPEKVITDLDIDAQDMLK